MNVRYVTLAAGVFTSATPSGRGRRPGAAGRQTEAAGRYRAWSVAELPRAEAGARGWPAEAVPEFR